MDHFGIGAAILGAVNIYLRAARGTGRTTSLIEGLHNGDCVVTTTSQEAKRIEHLCSERNIKVTCIINSAKMPNRIFELVRGKLQGRLFFDHTWVEQYYLNSIEQAQKDIDTLQRYLNNGDDQASETAYRQAHLQRWY